MPPNATNPPDDPDREDTAPPSRNETDVRRNALELRKAGASYEQIATKLGYPNAAAAHTAVQHALDEAAESERDTPALELERLNALLMGLWAKARQGNIAAVDRVLRIQDRRAKLLRDNPILAADHPDDDPNGVEDSASLW